MSNRLTIINPEQWNMHTQQDDISTMLYELYLLKRKEIDPFQRKWLERMWRSTDTRILPRQAERIFALHMQYVKHKRVNLTPQPLKEDALL
jgi:hypothetical protein